MDRRKYGILKFSDDIRLWHRYGTVMPSEPNMPFGQKGDILTKVS